MDQNFMTSMHKMQTLRTVIPSPETAESVIHASAYEPEAAPYK